MKNYFTRFFKSGKIIATSKTILYIRENNSNPLGRFSRVLSRVEYCIQVRDLNELYLA